MAFLLRLIVGVIGFMLIDASYGFADSNFFLKLLGVIILLFSSHIED